MFDEQLTKLRESIEGSLEDIERPWDYFIRVCFKVGSKVYSYRISGTKENIYEETEIDDELMNTEDEH